MSLMYIESLLLVVPLIIACILSIVSVLIVNKKGHSSVSFWFSILMITLIFWTMCYILELIFLEEIIVLFFAKLKYIGIILTPVSWSIFSLIYTKKRHSISKKMIISLILIPALSLIMLFTNPLHHLFWKSMSIQGNGIISIATGNPSIFFWIHTIYSYLLIFFGIILLLVTLFRTKDIFTKQNLLITFGVLTPFLGNIFIVLKFIKIPYNYDITPLLFVISGLLFSVAIIYFKFLELVPAAREEILEYVPQGIFVVNTHMNIVDKNKVATKLLKQRGFSTSDKNVIGTSFDSIFQDIFPDGILNDVGIKSHIIQIQFGSNTRWFDVSMDPLLAHKKRLEGHLIFFNDITVQKQTEKKLKKKIDELEKFKQVTIDRELKMIELKKQIEQLQNINHKGEL